MSILSISMSIGTDADGSLGAANVKRLHPVEYSIDFCNPTGKILFWIHLFTYLFEEFTYISMILCIIARFVSEKTPSVLG